MEHQSGHSHHPHPEEDRKGQRELDETSDGDDHSGAEKEYRQ